MWFKDIMWCIQWTVIFHFALYTRRGFHPIFWNGSSITANVCLGVAGTVFSSKAQPLGVGSSPLDTHYINIGNFPIRRLEPTLVGLYSKAMCTVVKNVTPFIQFICSNVFYNSIGLWIIICCTLLMSKINGVHNFGTYYWPVLSDFKRRLLTQKKFPSHPGSYASSCDKSWTDKKSWLKHVYILYRKQL